jgi:multiple antibiotic resistance protein
MPLNATELFSSMLVAIAALLPIVNPVGSAPVFLSMTADLPAQSRRMLSGQVALNAFVLLGAAMLIGSHVLRFFGISIPIVRVGGGMLVVANGWRMLNSDETKTAERPPVTDAWEREAARRAFYPLTFPLTIGPGSLSIGVTLGTRPASGGTDALFALAVNLIAAALVSLSVLLSYRFASTLIAFLGETGTSVFERLSSFILLCIGVSIVWSGILGLVQPLLKP